VRSQRVCCWALKLGPAGLPQKQVKHVWKRPSYNIHICTIYNDAYIHTCIHTYMCRYVIYTLYIMHETALPFFGALDSRVSLRKNHRFKNYWSNMVLENLQISRDPDSLLPWIEVHIKWPTLLQSSMAQPYYIYWHICCVPVLSIPKTLCSFSHMPSMQDCMRKVPACTLLPGCSSETFQPWCGRQELEQCRCWAAGQEVHAIKKFHPSIFLLASLMRLRS